MSGRQIVSYLHATFCPPSRDTWTEANAPEAKPKKEAESALGASSCYLRALSLGLQESSVLPVHTILCAIYRSLLSYQVRVRRERE
ncbi:hypothetical protein PC116_g26663 [Phytophthora cactorum]|uniref:Uncharacterized protein n=1 Tax=Phytophthora cactorum TaxID=29920 RepID=A0A8T1JID2_9STRA|nr:hypothetical protein PC111_g13910 [Phytophthora cactorum]KAG2889004.1 hypothetical protein PC117_g24782 [Phytophthora cactorum]KAG4224894.1 hypothetical protein PC116_g26663 [Phytophthora cactorum]